MNTNLDVQPEMLSRLNFAKANGCEAAADVLNLLERDDVPSTFYGSWWTRRVRNYRNVLKDVKFVHRDADGEQTVYSSHEFLELVTNAISHLTNNDGFAWPRDSSDYIAKFAAMILVNTRMNVMITSSRKKIEKYLHTQNWIPSQDLGATAYWENAPHCSHPYATVTAHFLTQVVKDARVLFVLDDAGKTMGFSIIYDKAKLEDTDRLAESSVERGVSIPVSILYRPIRSYAAVRWFVDQYAKEHYQELGIDVLKTTGYYTVLNHDHSVDEYARTLEEETDFYMVVPLNSCAKYKGGMPPGALLDGLCFVMWVDNRLYLTNWRSSQIGAPSSMVPKIENYTFHHCVSCGTGVWSKEGTCSKCRAEDRAETIFGEVITDLPRNLKYWGQVPKSYLDENGKLHTWAEMLLMFKKFTQDPQ